MAGFVHLRAVSCYSFLRGVGHPEAYLERAAGLGYDAFALTEDDYLCALPRFETAAREAGLHGLVGATITSELGPLAFLCRDREGYRQLCRLVSHAHLSHPRGEPEVTAQALEQLAGEHLYLLTGGRRGRLAELVRAGDEAGAEQLLRRFCELFGRQQVLVELQRLGCPGDRRLALQLAGLAQQLGLTYVATNDVRYPSRCDFPVYDLLTCTRYLKTVDEAFPGRPVNDLQYLTSPATMARRFRDLPEALRATVDVAADCAELRLSDDRFVPTYNGIPPDQQPTKLQELVEAGLRERYPQELWPAVRQRCAEELRIILALSLEGYFLLVWDVCRWARGQGIRCAGRGSAAGSVVCYVLRITNVDAFRREITLARFLNEERKDSLPDIDVDFARDGRDTVIEYLVKRYGVEHVAMTGTYLRYHVRSAVRDLGRALALPPGEIDALAKSLPHLRCDQMEGADDLYPDVRCSPWAQARFAQLRQLLPKLAGIPRHLGTHLGGVIITPEPLCELVGVQMAAKPFRVIHGDKEDVEDRLCKFDCLSLPMFSVLEDANRFVRRTQPKFEVFDLPLDDDATYARLQRSETWGAFEVGSPAQRALHARLHCDTFEPLVAALALIRPGPIKANMVNDYLARRHGEKPIEYWLPELQPVLEKTYGVLVFQEQVIEVARVTAGLSPAEADLLRRSISHYRSEDSMAKLGESFCTKAIANGLAPETAAAVFEAVRAFAGYGFCESHAAAFADTAYRSVYLIEHHPAAYFAALLRNQPMGFYPPHTLVGVAQRRGVKLVPPCIMTGPARTEARGHTIRIGLAQIKRILPDTADGIVARRPYHSLGELQRRTGLPRDQLACLIRAGACDVLSPHRRMLLWQLHELPTAPGQDGGLDLPPTDPIADPRLPGFSAADQLAGEWDTLGFSPSGHPVGQYREQLERHGVQPVGEVPGAEPGTRFRVCGLVLRPHRPPTKHGRNTLFFDLEDETGLIPITCFKEVYHRDGQAALHNPLVMVEGKVDARTGQGLIAARVEPLQSLGKLASSHARTLY